MRKTVVTEETQEASKPTKYSLKPQPTKETKNETTAAETLATPKRTREATQRPSIPLVARLGILLMAIIAGVGGVAVVAAQQSGVSLDALPSFIDLDAAYSPNNITQSKAFALIKLGNRKGAMALVKTLPSTFKSEEVSEQEYSQVRTDLINAQLQAGEYADAAQVAMQLPTKLPLVFQTQLERQGLDAVIANAKSLPATFIKERDNALAGLTSRDWAEKRRLLEVLETPSARDMLISNLMQTFPKTGNLDEAFALIAQQTTPLLQSQSLTYVGNSFINYPLTASNTPRTIANEEAAFRVLEKLKALKIESGGSFTTTVVGIIAQTDAARALGVFQKYGWAGDIASLQQISSNALKQNKYAVAEQVAELMRKIPDKTSANIGDMYARSVQSELFQKLKTTNPDEALRVIQKMETDSQQLALLEQFAYESLNSGNKGVFEKTMAVLKKLPGPAVVQRHGQLAQQAADRRQWKL